MLFPHPFLKSISFIVVLFLKTNAKDFPKTTSASIYESSDKKGPSVSFVDDMELWSDFRKMFHYANITKPTTICVRGAWLVYQNPDFRTQTVDDVHVFSGNENCVQPANISQYGSMQPIGPYKFRKNSITVFEKKIFGSFGISYFPHGKEVKKFRKSWLPTLESFITNGKSSWTLLDSNGKAYCIKPKSSFEQPICLLSELSQFKELKDASLVAVIANCGTEKKSSGTNNASSTGTVSIELSNCKEFGSAKLEKIEGVKVLSAKTVNAKEANDTCPNEDNEDPVVSPPLDKKMVKKFSKLRFTHDFNSPEQLLWPERKYDIWKTELIDTAFDIIMKTCPQEVVPTLYFQLIREFTIYHLDQAWKKEEDKKMKITPEIQDLTESLNECLVRAVHNKDSVHSQVLERFNSFRDPTQLDKEIYSVFKRDYTFDPVLESAWLVINYGLAVCHHLHDYATNFWAEYINVFKDLYFLPLINAWQKPKISPLTFKAILGGFGVGNQFKRIAFCTTIAFDLTPNLSPIEKHFPKSSK